MPKKKFPPAVVPSPPGMDADSLDREIAILRDLIQQAADKQTANSSGLGCCYSIRRTSGSGFYRVFAWL